ncbi:SAM dependent carboxyl methyltransferase [Corchorus capsularis]|uniref:SAM dependent carboxyl methyltransferase n=1 Tax=Corchorus capsularis TaxID=210143 RepID=A0A1R3GC07_COCAP|nr:SAM dependent carboxyl methyltransferase [Corchorus capsularis]
MANMEDTILQYPMVGGEGPQSYTQNSSIQKIIQENGNAKELIREAVMEKLDFKNLDVWFSNHTIRIADLGCSVGPNTFIAVQHIIEAIEFKYLKTHQGNEINLEFQVFFNDQANNDFNTLLRLLPSSRNYFANAVPGSFHGRLFPKSSLHFVHSACSLNWLSKVPEEVAWKEGISFLHTGLAKEVINAYLNQFKNDIDAFLTARAQEIVGGGLMVLIITGRPDGFPLSPTGSSMIFELLGSCLDDLANLGLIKQEKVDSFKLPLYYPNAKEMETIVDRNGYFSIEKMDKSGRDSCIRPGRSMDTHLLIASHLRAAFDSLLKAHFGINDQVVDEIFKCFPKKVANSNLIYDDEGCKDVDLFILLKRKELSLA